MYSIVIKNSAKKELDAIPADQFLKIDAAILVLKKNPHPYPQSKKLKGEDKCRLRVGYYRVVTQLMKKRRSSPSTGCDTEKRFTVKMSTMQSLMDPKIAFDFWGNLQVVPD